MSRFSPAVVLYGADGIAMAVKDGVAIPVNTAGMLAMGSDGTNAKVFKTTTAGVQFVQVSGPPAAAVTSVSASLASVMILDVNLARRSTKFFNNSSGNLYLKDGASASLVSFTVKIPAGGYFAENSLYTGRVDGFWDVADGAVLVTEMT